MEAKIKILGNACFWTAVIIELIAVIIDKSAYTNPYESLIFRAAFLLFCVKIAATKYSRAEYACILAIGGIAMLSYLINTRDESVRAVALIVACKDMDLRKILKLILAVTLAGSAAIVILSLTGVYGAVSVTADFGRNGIETRYCFGMGHPNAFHCMVFMIISLVIYLYAQKMKIVHFAALFAVNFAVYYFTDSNTAFIVLNAVLIGAVLMKHCAGLRESRIVYIGGALAFIVMAAFSTYGAFVGNGTAFMYKLDRLLNGRFEYAYMCENARAINWRLFAMPENQEYFDQGFIRLFYWYGIVIGMLYLGSNLCLIWYSYKKKDYMLFVLVLGYALFTMMEAHLISVYLLRNYLLIWLGCCWNFPFAQHTKEEGYFWQLPQMVVKRRFV